MNYYIVVAHLDDLEFGLVNYLQRITKKDTVYLYVASGGLNKHSKSINYARTKTQLINLTKLLPKKLKIVLRIETQPYDTLFFKNKDDIRTSLENWISTNINKYEKNTLITLAPDIHEDHRIISDLCDVIARPNLEDFSKSIFKSYLKFYIPNNYKYLTKYNLGSQYNNNTFCRNITILNNKQMELKKELLLKYPESIIKPDIYIDNHEIMIEMF